MHSRASEEGQPFLASTSPVRADALSGVQRAAWGPARGRLEQETFPLCLSKERRARGVRKDHCRQAKVAAVRGWGPRPARLRGWARAPRLCSRRRYGISIGPCGTGGLALIGGVLLLIVLYTVFRHASRTWWVWGTAVMIIFSAALLFIAPVYIEPLFNTYKPAPPGPAQSG